MKPIYFLCDVETSGLNPQQHHPWQLAYEIWQDGQMLKQCCTWDVDNLGEDFQTQDLGDEPEPSYVSAINSYPLPKSVRFQVEADLEHAGIDRYNPKIKAFFVAKNAIFDWRMLRAWWLKTGDKFFGSWFWYPPLDVEQLAAWHVGIRQARHFMPNFKQGTLAKQLRIDVDETKLHDALYDLGIMRQIIEKLGAKL